MTMMMTKSFRTIDCTVLLRGTVSPFTTYTPTTRNSTPALPPLIDMVYVYQ